MISIMHGQIGTDLLSVINNSNNIFSQKVDTSAHFFYWKLKVNSYNYIINRLVVSSFSRFIIILWKKKGLHSWK